MNNETFELEQKIKALGPYFDAGIHFLKKFSDHVKLSENDQIFETSARVVYPNIVLLDNPYPIIQCNKRSFFKQKQIEISYGIFAILGMLGVFEETTKMIIMYGLPYEETWKGYKEKLISCTKNALHYLEQTYNSPSGSIVSMPEMTMHHDIYYEALRFIVGHELSHYLDSYIKYDYRELQQHVINEVCYGLLKSLQRTRYKKYADKFINDLINDPNDYALNSQNMVEEVLADYEGYVYLWSLPSDPYKIVKHNTGVSIAFIVLRLMEYFENTVQKKGKQTFSIPVKWREIFLISLLHNRHYDKYDSIMEYLNAEWMTYQVLDSLFEQTISEIKSENLRNEKKECSAGQNKDFSAELSTCNVLIQKLQKASPSEVEDLFTKINNIFNENSSDDQFYRSFPAAELAEALCRIGYAFYENNVNEAAYIWWFRAVTFFDVSDEPERLLEADCYYYLGKICCSDGQYEQAASWYGQSLSIRQNHPRLSAQDNAELNLSFAGALIDSGQYDSASKTLQEMLTYTEDTYTIMEIYRKMGIISEQCNDNESALSWFKQALSIADSMFGPDNSDSATFYNSIGIIYYNMENYDDSEKYLTKSYHIKKKMLAPDHISLTNTMHSLGILETRRQRYDKAIEWFKQVLDIRLRTLGSHHPRVADTYQAMGIVYYFTKDYNTALKYHKRAYTILKSTLGIEHENTIKADKNIDLCLEELAKEE